MKKLFVLITLLLISTGIASAQVRSGADDFKTRSLPDPKLVFEGKEEYEANGQKWVRYKLSVTNRNVYPAAMFKAAPQLPACGANENSSRTWVDIFNAQNGDRLYGFCSLGAPANLDNLWFAVKQGQNPPKCVNMVMTDRLLNKTFKSNNVCFNSTVPVGPDDLTIGEADLTIEGFWFVQNHKTVRVLVKNTGAVNSKICVLRLTVRKINGTAAGRVTEINIPSIGVGKHISFFINADDILPNNVALKDTTFKLSVDANKAVNESNESNNEVWHNL